MVAVCCLLIIGSSHAWLAMSQFVQPSASGASTKAARASIHVASTERSRQEDDTGEASPSMTASSIAQVLSDAATSVAAAVWIGIEAGTDAFRASRPNATIIDVMPLTEDLTGRVVSSPLSLLRTSKSGPKDRLNPKAKRTKELLLSGPHSPLYSGPSSRGLYKPMTYKPETHVEDYFGI